MCEFGTNVCLCSIYILEKANIINDQNEVFEDFVRFSCVPVCEYEILLVLLF